MEVSNSNLLDRVYPHLLAMDSKINNLRKKNHIKKVDCLKVIGEMHKENLECSRMQMIVLDSENLLLADKELDFSLILSLNNRIIKKLWSRMDFLVPMISLKKTIREVPKVN
jgi:hypothetical protein